jgi:hypothetical protein
MPGKDRVSLEFFRRLKEREDVVVSAKELRPFKIVDSSHEPHGVSRMRIADAVKDLETMVWKALTNDFSTANMSDTDLYCVDMM